MSYPAKYFHSQMRGAPVLSGTGGDIDLPPHAPAH